MCRCCDGHSATCGALDDLGRRWLSIRFLELSLPPFDVRFYAAALASPKAKQTLGERHVIHLDVYRLRFHWPERLGKERQCTDCRLRVP